MAEDDVKTESVEQPAVENQDAVEDFSTSAETDPMIIAMREAEAEIAAGAKEPEKPAEIPAEKTEPKPGDQEAKATDDPVTIPKPRFDEVNSKLAAEKEKTAYLQGIVDVQKSMLSNGAPKSPAEQPVPEAKPAEPDIEKKIADLEAKKIELAKSYKNLDIDDEQKAEGDGAIDKEIRELTKQMFAGFIIEAERAAREAIEAERVESIIASNALRIQQENPYIAEIDKLPPSIRDGVWNEVNKEAVQILVNKGINPNDRIAFIQTKSDLVRDKYGPQFTGKTLTPVQTTAKQPSQAAIDRAAKIELSNRQPPSIANAGVEVIQELSEQDIMNMSPDQLADMYKAAPNRVNKAVGFK